MFRESELKCLENQVDEYVASIKRDNQSQAPSPDWNVKEEEEEFLKLNEVAAQSVIQPSVSVTKITEDVPILASVASIREETIVQENEESPVTGSDVNANPVTTVLEIQDINANDFVACALGIDSVKRRTSPRNVAKGTKRKQDRDSIDFDVLEARRPKLKAEVGALVEGSTHQILRTRGRNSHGHASDSTIQNLLYGPSYLNQQVNEDQNANIQSSRTRDVLNSVSARNTSFELHPTSELISEHNSTSEGTPFKPSSTSNEECNQTHTLIDENVVTESIPYNLDFTKACEKLVAEDCS